MKSFVICRMYAGSYISNKMGGEIINLLHDDSGQNYVYVNPYGYISDKYNNTVKGVVLTRLLKSGCFEILGIAKIGKNGQLVFPHGNSTEEKLKSSGEQIRIIEEEFQIKYAGVRLKTIYNNELNGSITFKSEKLLIPKEEIYITDSQNMDYKVNEQTFNLCDKRFPNQSLISYIDDVSNPKAFKAIENLINNDDLWYKNKLNKVVANTIIDNHFNMLKLIKKEDDELVYSNMFYYFFTKYPKLFQQFCDKVLNVQINDKFDMEREKANIDLWVKDKKNIIVIENKIKSGINGVSIRHDFSEDGLVQSQLLKYYNYAEENKGNLNTHYFIFVPNYNKINLKMYSGSKNYKQIKYSEIYEFLKNKKIDDVYYKEFVNSLYKHTKDRACDYYEDMANRFLKRIKEIKKN